MEKIRKSIALPLFFALAMVFGQEEETTPTEEMISEISVAKKDSVVTKRMKLDGIAAVIGDYVILDSDVEKTLIDLKTQVLQLRILPIANC